MDWSKVSSVIGKSAPLLGTLIGGPAGGALGAVIATALGTDNTPEAVSDFLYEHPSEAEIILRTLQEKNKNQYELMLLEVQKTSITQQALTQREEINSDNKFKSYWRPCFGYVMAIAFLILNIAFAYVIIKVVGNPAGMAATVAALSTVLGPMSIIWGMGLAVLGINVTNRTKGKQIAAGQTPVSMLSGLFTKK